MRCHKCVVEPGFPVIAPSWRGEAMKKHSVTLFDHRTSVCVEEPFWKALGEIAESRKQSVCHLIEDIDQDRTFANLSAALRLFVLQFYKEKLDCQTSEESKVAAQ
jgi:predicted DNA-binding ribbon-helix-helix protein